MPIDEEMRSTMRGEAYPNQQQPLVFDINSGKAVSQSGADTTVEENPWLAWGRKALGGLGAGMSGFAKGFSATWNGQPVDMSDYGDVAENFGEKSRKGQQEAEAKEGVETQNKVEPQTQVASTNNPYWNAWSNFKFRG